MVKTRNDAIMLGLYEKAMPDSLTWAERFQIAEATNYDFIEISIDETDFRLNRLYDKALQNEIREALKHSKIRLQSMCLSGHRKYPLGSMDDAVREKGLDIFYRAVDFAYDLGIRMIQLAGYDVYYETGTPETEKRFLEYLERGINYASKKGIVCGFETMETEFMNTVAKAKHYCDEIQSPYLKIYPDLGNLTNAAKQYKNDVLDDIDLGKGYLLAAHLKETEPGVFRNMEFGTGHVAFAEGIEALYTQGVRMFCCEFWNNDKTDYRERLDHNNKFIRKYFMEGAL